MTIRNILIISEQRSDFTTLTAALERADPGGFEISTVSTLEQPVEALMDRDNDAVILAHSLETEYLLRLAQKAKLATPIIVLIDLESEKLINKLKDAGASDYLVRGMLTDDLIHRVLDYSIALKGAGRSSGAVTRSTSNSPQSSHSTAAPVEPLPRQETSAPARRGERNPVMVATSMLDKQRRDHSGAKPPTLSDPEAEDWLPEDETGTQGPGPEAAADAELPTSLDGFTLTGPEPDAEGKAAFDEELDLDQAPPANVELDASLEAEFEPELELDSPLLNTGEDDDSVDAELEFDTDFEVHPEFDNELDLGDAELELEPVAESGVIEAEELQLGDEVSAGDGSDVLAGPIAEALEALRAGAPTAPIAHDPAPPGPQPSGESPAVAQLEQARGGAIARQGPMLVLVCILLAMLGMLGAGVFRLNDTLNGLENRVASEGTVARGAQQPQMGEELWREMRQRNEELSARLDQLQAQLAASEAGSGQSGPEAAEVEAGEAVSPDTPPPKQETITETVQAQAPEEAPTPVEEELSPLELAIAEATREQEVAAETRELPAETAPADGDAELPPLVEDPAPGWFINMGSFGSYQAAAQWAASLDPDSYEVEVSALSREGRDLYRVRIVGIEDRRTARDLAQRFQRELYLNQLWVGKD